MPTDHVSHLVNLLTFVSQRNEVNLNKRKSLFHMDIFEPLRDLIWRLDENIRCSPSCYAVALVYVDRLTESNPDVPLNMNTVNLLFTTSLLLANQFMDDKAERALQFSRVAGIHPSLMARLKIDFIFRISFSLLVTPQEISGYSDKLLGRFSSRHFRETGMWDGIGAIVPQVSTASRVPVPSKPPKSQPKDNTGPHIRAPTLSQEYAARPKSGELSLLHRRLQPLLETSLPQLSSLVSPSEIARRHMSAPVLVAQTRSIIVCKDGSREDTNPAAEEMISMATRGMQSLLLPVL
jgi:hypothetical protein